VSRVSINMVTGSLHGCHYCNNGCNYWQNRWKYAQSKSWTNGPWSVFIIHVVGGQVFMHRSKN